MKIPIQKLRFNETKGEAMSLQELCQKYGNETKVYIGHMDLSKQECSISPVTEETIYPAIHGTIGCPPINVKPLIITINDIS